MNETRIALFKMDMQILAVNSQLQECSILNETRIDSIVGVSLLRLKFVNPSNMVTPVKTKYA